MNKFKIIFDCNVIISAFLFKNSSPRLALEKAKENHIVLISNSIIEELETVIKRKKFDRYVSLNTRE